MSQYAFKKKKNHDHHDQNCTFFFFTLNLEKKNIDLPTDPCFFFKNCCYCKPKCF